MRIAEAIAHPARFLNTPAWRWGSALMWVTLVATDKHSGFDPLADGCTSLSFSYDLTTATIPICSEKRYDAAEARELACASVLGARHQRLSTVITEVSIIAAMRKRSTLASRTRKRTKRQCTACLIGVFSHIPKIVKIILGFVSIVATLLGYYVLQSRIGIDVRDPNASLFWETRFNVSNNGALAVRDIVFLCYVHNPLIAQPPQLNAPLFFMSARTGYFGYGGPRQALSPGDEFDAVCAPGLKLTPEATGKFSDLELIIGFRNFLGWRNVSCARFTPQITSERQTHWQRQAADTGECRTILEQYEEGQKPKS